MKRFFALAFGVALVGFSACSNEGISTGNDAEPTGGCSYDKHSIYVQVDSIVPVSQLGPQDTTSCDSCDMIYYHTVSGEQITTKCMGTIGGPGPSQLMNGEGYYKQDFVLQYDLVAQGNYLMRVDELVSGDCAPCVVSFVKRAP